VSRLLRSHMLVMTKHLLSQHSPRLDTCQVGDKEILKTQELDFAKGFSKDICQLFVSRYMSYLNDLSFLNAFTNKVVTNIDMFRSSFLRGILRQKYGTHVVLVEYNGWNVKRQLLK